MPVVAQGPANAQVAIIGGGPAGLSAAITLGRACRRVVLFDHGNPRNKAARGIHCFLGHDGISPDQLRALGRAEALRYGANIVDAEVIEIQCEPGLTSGRFRIRTSNHELTSQTVLLATGVIDQLPRIPGVAELYGRSVHHCPYCDGWEHRGEHLVALGQGDSAVELSLELRNWSDRITLCSNSAAISPRASEHLNGNGIAVRTEAIRCLEGTGGRLAAIEFVDGPKLACDAVFFSSGQGQRSPLASTLGCECDADGLIVTGEKHCTNVPGVYVAGDADGDSQFAIIAAAEGVAAAVAIDKAMREQNVA